MPTTPKDVHSLDYSDVDSLADYVCEAMFLDKGQHKEFFRTLFDNCSIKCWEEGYGMGFKNGIRQMTADEVGHKSLLGLWEEWFAKIKETSQ